MKTTKTFTDNSEETMKSCNKHGLSVDQTFFNKTDIVEQTGVSIRSIDKWIEKDWIDEIKLIKVE